MPNTRPYLASFGRTHSKHLRGHQKGLMQTLLPQLSLSLDKPLPEGKKPIWLEIGYGAGEHLAHQAKNNPEVNFIGCEVYDKGIAQLLAKIEQDKLSNVSLFTDDVRLLLEKIPSSSIDKAFILFPDPWPKNRHHKRRIIGQETLAMLERIMKPGAVLRIATDWQDYAKWIMVQLNYSKRFEWRAENKNDWLVAPPDHIVTRYQQKAINEERTPVFLEFILK